MNPRKTSENHAKPPKKNTQHALKAYIQGPVPEVTRDATSNRHGENLGGLRGRYLTVAALSQNSPEKLTY